MASLKYRSAWTRAASCHQIPSGYFRHCLSLLHPSLLRSVRLMNVLSSLWYPGLFLFISNNYIQTWQAAHDITSKSFFFASASFLLQPISSRFFCINIASMYSSTMSRPLLQHIKLRSSRHGFQTERFGVEIIPRLFWIGLHFSIITPNVLAIYRIISI